MDYSELPTHLNSSHLGANSPVRMRFEGGNSRGGFCIEQYTSTAPFLKFYGDAPEARRIFMSAVQCLPSFTDIAIDGGVCNEGSAANQGWFQFEYRSQNYRVLIYCGPHGESVIRNGVTTARVSKAELRADLRAAHARLASIYGRYYDV